MTDKGAPERLRETDSPAREEDVARIDVALEETKYNSATEYAWNIVDAVKECWPRLRLAIRPAPASMKPEWREEVVALCNFLEIALDVHDDHFGATDDAKFPMAWDVQARRMLDAARAMLAASRASVERALADALPSAVGVPEGWQLVPTGAVRCLKTGNPFGTDTWMVGHSCDCAVCHSMLAAAPSPQK